MVYHHLTTLEYTQFIPLTVDPLERLSEETTVNKRLSYNYFIMSFLLKNAKLFLEEAERDFQYGNWNFVLFHSEQALQLCLKYKIFSYAGD